jgi:CHASE2 domain-containing sensor protein
MASDMVKNIGKLIETAFRFELIIWIVIFGAVFSYFLYGQLITIVPQLAAVVGGGAVGVLCAAGLAYLAVTMDW